MDQPVCPVAQLSSSDIAHPCVCLCDPQAVREGEEGGEGDGQGEGEDGGGEGYDAERAAKRARRAEVCL